MEGHCSAPADSCWKPVNEESVDGAKHRFDSVPGKTMGRVVREMDGRVRFRQVIPPMLSKAIKHTILI